ncbi:hypothetical protein Ssi03_72520 [Sphaerisporangium siamense]|uniref:GNAT superfamily N-acetyltransferase n=1 Tax=Sphaerisporangium siamense TaxID=795645 RepID=A0A7W7D5N2_9ACTN|nr:GNAT family N-acetyltransferase [Sphaerisporangium siamense]MBB4699351.1 GNAT superfamily N-acetyltransferase [Sphaerisporangium siamense]GII89262.1 hypothetical protein Ssi03_72520 [Sphaerisporangium siamense]
MDTAPVRTRTSPVPRTGAANGLVRLVEPAALYRHLTSVADVAGEVFGRPPWSEASTTARALAARMLADSHRPGFVLAMALHGENLYGFAYGIRCSRLATLAHRLPTGDFTLKELAVLPQARGTGLGAALHDTVLAAAGPGPRWLATHVAATEALGLYRARGWHSVTLVSPTCLIMRRQYA